MPAYMTVYDRLAAALTRNMIGAGLRAASESFVRQATPTEWLTMLERADKGQSDAVASDRPGPG